MRRTARPVGWGPGPSRDQASAAGPSKACRRAWRSSWSMNAVGGSACVPSKWARTRDTFSRHEPPRRAACQELNVGSTMGAI
eukprot:7466553-Alexandrium_andersonii.AAC.1